ncbi:hypothetical protein QLX08_003042 [Tetragonisca angustula]|uniref:Uncharacterized protein n=1 Tax=Tetragonisca angustula TaxID=166442 RepID=A0AAW1A8K0_9HYME
MTKNSHGESLDAAIQRSNVTPQARKPQASSHGEDEAKTISRSREASRLSALIPSERARPVSIDGVP